MDAAPAPNRRDRGFRIGPPDEAKQLPGQTIRQPVKRLGCWELGGQTGRDNLEETLHVREVLETVLAEITEGHPFSRSRSDQSAGRVGEEDLPAVTSSANPSRSVHVDAFVSGFKAPFAGMKPHSDLDRCIIGPRMRLQGLLRRHRRGHSFLCAQEHREECVPLAVYFLTPVFLNGGTE